MILSFDSLIQFGRSQSYTKTAEDEIKVYLELKVLNEGLVYDPSVIVSKVVPVSMPVDHVRKGPNQDTEPTATQFR